MKKYLIIHGHFYQPPRENPWIGDIERQYGAHPYHDFNEKISAECYTPNAFSKYLDGYGRILDIVNNYSFLDFNFGPTLMKWIKEKQPETYDKIREGDRISCERFEGHGNAIAQVYNHAIMPLGDKTQKKFQIIWGIKDFINHFNREPEGMWLAETAIDFDTVRALIDNNIKFTVLSPYQALKLRDITGDKWVDVSQGTISPSVAYRIYDYDDSGKRLDDRFLDVFFFDRMLSPAVSFEHLMRDSHVFFDRIKKAGEHIGENEIVNIATDGETFGHHEPFANMCLTALSKEISGSEYEWVNYSWFLANNPPEKEVILKKGDLGTAWSCSHGVGRWYRDCGCTTDSPADWNQKWRTPLRDGFNFLKEKIDNFYLENLSDICDVPWDLLYDSLDFLEKDAKNGWLNKHIKGKYDPIKVKNMLLMMKYTMLTFTSCAWFFGDISRIEPVQNMKYAKKALDIMSLYDKERALEIEKDLLMILEKGRSNLEDQKDGRNIWKNSVLPARVSDDKFAAFYMINLLITSVNEPVDIFNRKVSGISELEKYASDKDGLQKNTICVKVYDKELNIEREFLLMGEIKRPHIIKAFVCAKDAVNLTVLKEAFKGSNYQEMFSKNGVKEFGLHDMFYDQKEYLSERLFESIRDKVSQQYFKIYKENIDILNTMLGIGIEPPKFLTVPISFSLKQDIVRSFESYCEKNSEEIYDRLMNECLLFKRISSKDQMSIISDMLEEKISCYFDDYFRESTDETLDRIYELFKISWAIDVSMGLDREKNLVFSKLREFIKERDRLLKENRLSDMDFNGILKFINIAEALNLNVDKFRESLNPFKKD